jgi:type III secretion protein T
MNSTSLETYGVIVLVFARVYTFINLLPLIGGEEVPGMVKTVFCAGLTPFLVIPMIALGIDNQITAPFYLLLIKELIVGALMSLLVSLPLRIPELIGDVIDNQRGAAVTDSYNPTSGEQSSMLGQLLSLTVFTYFLSEGGLNQLVNVLANSFNLTPAGSMNFLHFGDKKIYDSIIGLFVSYMSLFAILALPVMVAMFMAEISLAIASRFAQSLNVFSMAQPIKALIAIAMMVPLLVKINSAIMQALQYTMRMFGDV